MPVTGLRDILGSRNVETLSCNITELIDPIVGPDIVNTFTGTATVDTATGVLNLSGFPPNYAQAAQANFDGNLNSLCSFDLTVGLSNFSSTFGGISSSGTGIFEFIPMTVTAASAAILISVILAGISWAKRVARNFSEETSADDAIEYYEDAQGRERWRIKASVRNRLDN